jgi:hypothetical protein
MFLAPEIISMKQQGSKLLGDKIDLFQVGVLLTSLLLTIHDEH